MFWGFQNIGESGVCYITKKGISKKKSIFFVVEKMKFRPKKKIFNPSSTNRRKNNIPLTPPCPPPIVNPKHKKGNG